MPLRTRTLRLAAALLAAGVVALGSLPATAAAASSAAPSAVQGSATTAASDHHGPVVMGDDAAHTSSSARRASYAWAGRRITYFETMPAKWDWSLSTAIGKWNGSGGGIRFVRTASRSTAQLTITYARIGPAAGMATVGRTRHAFVRLSSRYSSVDSLDAHNRIEVMMVFAHELGHVLGFEHTQTACSLMAPVLDVEGCHMIPETQPGYYKCRTINAALVARFVRIYGGRAKYPASWCPIDKIPSPLSQVDFTGGKSSPVTISWVSPANVPAGSQVLIHSWQSDSCGAVPNWAGTTYAPVSTGAWQDPQVEPEGTSCFSVQLVNRYGAGQQAVASLIAS